MVEKIKMSWSLIVTSKKVNELKYWCSLCLYRMCILSAFNRPPQYNAKQESETPPLAFRARQNKAHNSKRQNAYQTHLCTVRAGGDLMSNVAWNARNVQCGASKILAPGTAEYSLLRFFHYHHPSHYASSFALYFVNLFCSPTRTRRLKLQLCV